MIDAGVLFQQAVAALRRTWIALGDAGLAGVYRDRLTGLTATTEPRDGQVALACPSLFGHLPVARLTRERSAP
jgi:hypothetical protein